MKALLMSVAAVALVASGSAHAGIEECSQPPYGGTMAPVSDYNRSIV